MNEQLISNILCVDLEDWYHPEYVKSKVSGIAEGRINQSLDLTLNLLSKNNVKATFFVVGELAEKNPNLLIKIKENGHEIAFHGYNHDPLWELNEDRFRLELEKYKSLVQSVTGERCLGFRAPSYSLDNETKWAIKALKDTGFTYDSSVFPVRTPLYGEASAPITPYYPSTDDISKNSTSTEFMEFPALVYPFVGLKIPAAGGFYLRTLPVSLLKRAIRRMNKHGYPAVLTIHNWELDPQTPRLKLGLYKSFVTYHNLTKTSKKLSLLLSEFSFTSFKNYLEKK